MALIDDEGWAGCVMVEDDRARQGVDLNGRMGSGNTYKRGCTYIYNPMGEGYHHVSSRVLLNKL